MVIQFLYCRPTTPNFRYTKTENHALKKKFTTRCVCVQVNKRTKVKVVYTTSKKPLKRSVKFKPTTKQNNTIQKKI